MYQNITSFYQNNIDQYSQQLNKLNKKISIAAFSRLAAFLTGMLAIYLYASHVSLLIVAPVFAFSLVLFFVLIKYSGKLSEQKVLTNNLLVINQNELKFLNFDYQEFSSGNEYIKAQHPYMSDLNIFGEASVYQYINRATTCFGRTTLANWLSNPLTDKTAIEQRQQACRELTSKINWRQMLQAKGMATGNSSNDINGLILWINELAPFKRMQFVKLIALILPILTGISLVTSIYTDKYGYVELLILCQILIAMLMYKKVNAIHDKLSSIYKTLQGYSHLLYLIEKKEFTASILQKTQQKLNNSAAQSTKELSDILQAFDRRANILVSGATNALYLSDLQNVIKLNKWKTKYKNNILQWFDVLGEFEAYSSLAGFAYNNPSYQYPEIIAAGYHYKAEQIGHPLIHSAQRVCNDFEIDGSGSFVILTGANMAGKSTFLRTVGLNKVLAQAGAPVCAQKLSLSPIPLMSSISVKDSLKDNESYFYAEIKRLKMIIDELNLGSQLFIILDEILKGTNSKDKLSGSNSLMKQLMQYNTMGIIATHDTQLGELELSFPEKIKNHSFEVELNNDILYYDYKLHKGICKNLNATILMRKMGIITEG